MSLEHVFITVIFCAAVIPIVATLGNLVVGRKTVTLSLMGAWLLVLCLVLTIGWLMRAPVEVAPQATFRPKQVPTNGYVGSNACRSCHPHEHSTWHDSYHRTMTQVATADSLIPAVNHDPIQIGPMQFRLSSDGDNVWADVLHSGTPGQESQVSRMSRRIAMTTGSHHMQLLWYPQAEDNRLLGMFPFVYLIEQKRWIPRGAAFLQPAFSLDDELGRWNQTCIVCHATHGRMRAAEGYDAELGEKFVDASRVDSEVSEFGISCEACHGPGQQHVQQNHSPVVRYQKHLTNKPDATIVNPVDLPHDLESQVCGQCHSVQMATSVTDWSKDGFAYRPGDDLHTTLDRFIFRVSDQPTENEQRVMDSHPEFVQDHFWPDGMVRISGREYSGLIESPCYQRGELSCLSCHQMHQSQQDDRQREDWKANQLDELALANTACTQCHAKLTDSQQLTEHTHHAADSTGSQCYNCHMPYTTYGLLKAIRSHEIDVPSVATTLTTGRPNACNQCHLDKTLKWTSQHLADWFDTDSPELTDDQQTIAASVLWMLEGDAGLRAITAWTFGWSAAQEASGTQWMTPYLAQLLEDPYAAVRFIAAKSLESLTPPAMEDYDFIGNARLLADVHQRLLHNWNATNVSAHSEVLIDANGKLQDGTFQRLLELRDDRPITLVE